MKKRTDMPPGWDEARVGRLLAHYENQSDSAAAAEDDAAFTGDATVMRVPKLLVPAVRAMIAKSDKSAVRRTVPRRRQAS